MIIWLLDDCLMSSDDLFLVAWWFWDEFGMVLGWFWDDFGTVLGGMLDGFGIILGWPSVYTWYKTYMKTYIKPI